MTRRLLGLFARRPEAGRVKTRLAASIGAGPAAVLYEAMLLDIADQHARSDHDLALWYTPDDAEPWFREHLPAVYRRLAQRGPDLASRMRVFFQVHADEGYDRIVLRGTDSPSLPAERVEEAFHALDDADLVVCPDLDGGYNLIGLCAPCDAILDIPMSTASVLEQTLARAEREGLRTQSLEAHHDVDTIHDLERLAGDIDATRAPRTARFIRESVRPRRH
ncbi:MAG: TIGR04282 family arsenosugar biosynthesis glycosyltransferase [Deltaproteobacteria bacterium]|nr:TIGR04282 family arsenosugar biosynthesis glycosyltransferase [Deltaproteobacteria bacterium]MBW2416833.1 TIGR04282 family arsenosugar biosynthesis glycosyltransferase [Deltaproteobacteria bacterium]